MKRKLILTFGSIALVLITAITSTFAAIQFNSQAYVTAFSLSANTDGVTKISVDGVNYSEDLSLNEIKKGIVAKYKGYTFNNTGNYLDQDGNVIEPTEELVNNYFDEIELSSVTSFDGANFKNLNIDGGMSTVIDQSGQYVSVDLYFKSIVDSSFSLYFNTVNMNTDGNEKYFKITGDKVTVNSNSAFKLDNGFQTYDKTTGDIIKYSKDDSSLIIDSAGALRFSTTVDDKTKSYSPVLGLGSYSTDLNSDMYDGTLRTYASRFDSNKNASYTYEAIGGSQISKLNYDETLKTFENFEEIDSLQICDFKYNGQVKKVEFNFWLEGFDADCFKTILGSKIKIQLSFRGTQNVESFSINYIDGDDSKTIDYLLTKASYVSIPIFPTKDGYIFEGWYKDDDFTEAFDFEEVVTPQTQTRDAYAKWSIAS